MRSFYERRHRAITAGQRMALKGEVYMRIPDHVIYPSDGDYLPTTKCPPMDSSSLGYAVLRALGAHEQLTDEAIQIVIQWTDSMHEKTGRLTPHTDKLENVSDNKTLVECVRVRLGPKFQANIACMNAAKFRGDRRRPSYESLFADVWVAQQWPDLCRALSSSQN